MKKKSVSKVGNLIKSLKLRVFVVIAIAIIVPVIISSLFILNVAVNTYTEKKIDRFKSNNTMLKNSDLPINEIAKQTGFASTAYFCRVYKKLYGKTPTQFKTV